jgi:hypothetical protein
MTNDETLASILQQNAMMISLLARLVWPPEKLVEMVMANKKKNPEAYVTVYNALNGEKTGKQLGEIAGVSKQAISGVLQGWLEDGIVMNVGSEAQPKYRRLMKLPEKRKGKNKFKQAAVAEVPVTTTQMQATAQIEETTEANATSGQ